MIVKGTNSQEQAGELFWSKTEGYRRSRIFHGTHAAMQALVPSLMVDGADSIHVAAGPADSKLIAVYTTPPGEDPEEPITYWELVSNDLGKSVYEHNIPLGWPEAVLIVVKKALIFVEDGRDNDGNAFGYDQAVADITAVVTAALSEPERTTVLNQALALFHLTLKGTDSFSVDATVLRKIGLVSSTYEESYSFDGVGEIWTTGQLTMVETSIHPGVTFGMNSIPAPTARTGYLWGWLKKRPTVQQIAGGKVQLTQEWWLEQWSTLLYPAHS